MRFHRLSAAAVLALAGLALPVLAAPPSDAKVKAAADGFVEATKSASGREAYEKAAREALEGIEISELSARQIVMLMKAGPIAQASGKGDEIAARLETLARQDDVDGAIAASYLVPMKLRTTRDTAARVALVERVAEHPRLKEAMASGDAANVLPMLQMMGPDASKEAWDHMVALARVVDEETAPKLAGGFVGYNSALLAGAGDDAARKDAQNRIRTRLAELAADAARSADGEKKDELAGVVRYLNGPLARGESLVGATAPDLNFIWSNHEGIKTLADLRGKVVVVDFWATWCGPCIGSFPQVRDLAAHYEGYPVVVLGVTSLQGSHSGPGGRIDTKGDPQREFALMSEFIGQKDMTWPVAFSKEPVFNPEYGVQGIPHVVIIDAEGKVRHRGLHPAGPKAEKTAKIDELLKEAGLPRPGTRAGTN